MEVIQCYLVFEGGQEKKIFKNVERYKQRVALELAIKFREALGLMLDRLK